MDSPDVLVIGGGVIGLACAEALVRRGADVLLLERNSTVGREASWASLGFLRHRVSTRDAYGWLSRTSHESYPEYAIRLRDETGIDPEYRREGGFEVAFTPEKEASLRRFVAFHLSRGIPAEWKTPEDVLAMEPRLNPENRGAAYHPEDAQIRPPRLLKALAAAFERQGGRIRTGIEALALRWEGTGDRRRCLGVRTSEGTIEADTTLLAAGPWSGLLAERAGLFLPVRPVRGQVLRIDAPPGTLHHTVSAEGIYLAQRGDGTFLVGSTIEEVGFESGTTPEGIETLRSEAVRTLPGLEGHPIIDAWAGLRPAPAHRFPYIGPVAKGLWVATAHYRVGVLLAPATAILVADGILTGRTPVPLDDFDPERDRRRVARLRQRGG